MNKLFSLSFRRIALRLGHEELSFASLEESLAKNNIADCGAGLFYRLPQKQFKHIVMIPCPVNEVESPESQHIIASSKMLRHYAGVKEEKVCFKCPFKDSCQQVKKPFGGETNNTAKHLLTYWIALNNYGKVEEIYFRQLAATYKLGDSIIALLNDLAQGGKQIEQYERLRLEAAANFIEKQKNQEDAEDDKKFEKITQQIDKISSKKVKGREDEKSYNPQGKKFAMDYSFDEQEDIKPTKIYKGKGDQQFSQNAFERSNKKETRQYNRSYITPKQDSEDNRSQKYQKYGNKYEQKRQYDRPNRDYKQRDNSYERSNRDYKQKDNNYDRPNRNYDQRQNFDRPNKKYQNRQQYDRPAKNYQQRQDFNPYKDERKPQREQYQKENKFYKKNYRDQYTDEDYTSRKQQYEPQRKSSRDDYRNPKEQERYGSKQGKDNKDPFVKKWKPEKDYQLEDQIPKNNKKPQWKQDSYKLDDIHTATTPSRPQTQASSPSRPKIIEVQAAEDERPTQRRVGRAVRRGSRGRSTSQDE